MQKRRLWIWLEGPREVGAQVNVQSAPDVVGEVSNRPGLNGRPYSTRPSDPNSRGDKREVSGTAQFIQITDGGKPNRREERNTNGAGDVMMTTCWMSKLRRVQPVTPATNLELINVRALDSMLELQGGWEPGLRLRADKHDQRASSGGGYSARATD